MVLWRYSIRLVHARSDVHTVKPARKTKKHRPVRQQRELSGSGNPAGNEPLDTIAFTARLTISRNPGFLLFIFHPQESPAGAGLVRHADLTDKPLRYCVRCRSPPSSISI